MRLSKEIKRTVSELQGIVHSQNLYTFAGRRVINPHVNEAGQIVVNDLYTDKEVPFVRGEFRNGYGQTV